jgi:general L-amino acid transport system permease protein
VETIEKLGHTSHEKPPVTTVGPLGWLHSNLFSNWLNTSLTLVALILIYAVARAVIPWALYEANWRVIPANISVLTYGRYPREEAWRLAVSMGVILALGILTWRIWRDEKAEAGRRGVLIGWLLSPILLTLLIRGFSLPTPATVGNNIGYYVYRPELIPLLGEGWRANAALIIMGTLAGVTWGLYEDRRRRFAAVAAWLAILGFLTPLGLQMSAIFPGLHAPLLVPMLVSSALAFAIGLNLGRSMTNVEAIRRWLLWAWILVVLFLLLILTAFDVGVERVAPSEILQIIEPNIWSGIMLTLLLSVVSIVASFPIGVLLALGRRSELPVVKVFCILFIEVVRGVPLITILFMAQVMLPLFLPLEVTVDRVIRAMAGMTLFTAAYLAEIVRGGLQAVRHEQVEAARALGLSELLVTGLIVLPQALRAVIPPIMGQFVSIFKDTTLVAIVGLLDLLAVGQSVIKQREFLGAVREIYIFAGIFYFIFSYAMSVASRRLERQLGVSEQ